jgi:RimJ/RimL family protein N-acetyltransferase
MVRDLLAGPIGQRRLLARCFPASIAMKKILRKCGFDELGDAEGDIAVFARK